MIHDVIIQIFGEYQPVVHVLDDGTALMGVDWGYIAGVAIFAICLWSAFRMLGMLFKR